MITAYRLRPSRVAGLRQSAGARLFERHYSPVLITVAVGDGADQAVAPDVAAGQWHRGKVAGLEREIGIFEAERSHLADLGVALVDHDLAVDLVGRAVEQAVGHDVVEHADRHAVLAGEREAFA